MRRRNPRRPGIFSKERTPEASEAALRRDVLLSLQRALWDMVTPQLRGIAASQHRSIARGSRPVSSMRP